VICFEVIRERFLNGSSIWRQNSLDSVSKGDYIVRCSRPRRKGWASEDQTIGSTSNWCSLPRYQVEPSFLSKEDLRKEIASLVPTGSEILTRSLDAWSKMPNTERTLETMRDFTDVLEALLKDITDASIPSVASETS
jgi:hypothetical protein